ncbi:PRTRC system protein E [Cupriavidus sp. NPDC089707]|uniref:PRTRC system protein E n=1 Tax=Cupriavidus sp. NPDC089707 TaxID=3363963 RepID=UPI0037FF62F3
MFTELAALVRASEKVVVTLTMQGDTMSVVVVPVIKDAADAALSTPLALAATPAELDEGFAAAVAGVSAARQSLAEQVEATKSILEAAKTSQSTKATKALAKAAASTASETTRESDDDDQPQGDSGAQATTPAVGGPSVPTGTDLASLL